MAIKDFGAGSNAPEKNLAHTRTGIQKVVEPAISAALKTIAGLDLGTAEHLRRAFRATVNVAIRMMLDAGAPPQVVAAQLGEALAHELEERKAAQDAAGKAQVEEAQDAGGAPIFAPIKGDGSLKN